MSRNSNSNFYEEVYEIIKQIPEGKVTTYGDIAKAVGRPKCARTVGYALANCKEVRNLPCHRVVNKKGILAPTPVFGGKSYQKMLLEQEGVGFLTSDTIDMAHYLWQGPTP